jgi:uncharacterized coiled-coil protein SlyX
VLGRGRGDKMSKKEWEEFEAWWKYLEKFAYTQEEGNGGMMGAWSAWQHQQSRISDLEAALEQNSISIERAYQSCDLRVIDLERQLATKEQQIKELREAISDAPTKLDYIINYKVVMILNKALAGQQMKYIDNLTIRPVDAALLAILFLMIYAFVKHTGAL